jgi:hypothetical protein
MNEAESNYQKFVQNMIYSDLSKVANYGNNEKQGKNKNVIQIF